MQIELFNTDKMVSSCWSVDLWIRVEISVDSESSVECRVWSVKCRVWVMGDGVKNDWVQDCVKLSVESSTYAFDSTPTLHYSI